LTETIVWTSRCYYQIKIFYFIFTRETKIILN